MEFSIHKNKQVHILLSDGESPAVKIAARNLETDLQKVMDGIKVHNDVQDSVDTDDAHYVNRGDHAVIHIASADIAGGKIPLSVLQALSDENGKLRKEAYQIRVHNGELYITGSDRRGTVYGIYSLCEQMGVSPWRFLADVPVKKREEFTLPENYCVTDYPSVEYRGIFINDEEELEAWAQNYMKEPTIGIRTYEKIFELLLRLKANYIWPAMHVNSFNRNPENGALAERMGIVVGTSHCDMLMRSNNKEWLPWITEKGYTNAVYDYSIEGRNREILQEYWQESVEQNKDFEVCYTLGMRGIHDSGFETGALEGMENQSAEEKRRAKIKLLERIISDQRSILKQTLSHMPMMTFIPYKEVLELYDNGLSVPEDMTLVWANDNYGYIRRFPSESEQKRAGGNGIYYHNSYWASPGMSYVFLCSIPLAHTRNELQKAWNEGIRKLWVLNSGAMKPLELEITFFLSLAWEIGKEDALTKDVETFVADWADKTFSGKNGREVSMILHDFSQLTNVRKVEHMENGIFSQTAYGDEAAVRIHKYEELFQKGNSIYESLPEIEKPAFYQMVLLRIHAAYFTNLAYYYADRSTLMYERGNMQAAALYTEKSRMFEDIRRSMIAYYNTVMSDGKWNGILNPEGYPPPRAAMMPICTPPLAITGAPKMRVDIWNEEEELEFTDTSEKWIEIGNTGTGAVRVKVFMPAWITITAADAGSKEETIEITDNILSAQVETELRICMRVTNELTSVQGRIVAQSIDEGFEKHIPVYFRADETDTPGMADEAAVPCMATEEDGVIVLEADSAAGLLENATYSGGNVREGASVAGNAYTEDFHVIRRLGSGWGSLVEARKINKKPLVYTFSTKHEGEFLLELHRFPSLNATGRIRIGIAADGDAIRILESFSNDEWKGTWKENVLNNVERLYMTLPFMNAGKHQIALYAVDDYFAFSRLIIYTKPRKENRLAGIRGVQCLPKQWEAVTWAKAFYGRMENRPRAVEYAPVDTPSGEDTLARLSRNVQETEYAKKITPDWYFQQGAHLFTEKDGAVKIDAAAALAQSPFAWKTGDDWCHCAGESFGRSGLCLYVRAGERVWERTEDMPALHYRFYAEGGSYTVWMLVRFRDERESHYRLGMDGEVWSEEKLYRHGNLFRYEGEQIYQWIPAAVYVIEQGEHILDIYHMASGMRFDRFYLTKGSELPPVDTKWWT
ncbi:MAG: glycosyl hydrolase 115 family protein [Clostridium sp.]|nr:glycosyl hydrolase 115 family protein [Clostridium sp.]